ncbi:MAG TPA: aminotransferase class I/II-fold pyridoxal phosphate-dependent enzyme [Vicinamibacterales bacterium]|nr:aminotransferase class I/II-fold pyridoxal phosphate-dependent enzyme [Vicinamibacterales bacterium]
MPTPVTMAVSLADERDRARIYAIRHQVYAEELKQHAENSSALLIDKLDEVNVYLVAKCSDEIVGFVSITPPNDHGYSVDKYFSRASLPAIFDQWLYEVRLLTVTATHRGASVALLLMYAALRYVEAIGARTIVAVGRLEVLPMYRRAGLEPLGLRVKSGEVTYELMVANVRDLLDRLVAFDGALARLERRVDWRLNAAPFRRRTACYHGGEFFNAIGDDFKTLERKDLIINADVLDAWFDPAPSLVRKLAEHLPFALRTSPPTGCDGMQRAIGHARGVAADSILPGAGSSDLIFAGLRHWVTPRSRVLILDPMYGEYAHVLENVIGARVDRLSLSRTRSYDLNLDDLSALVRRGYDWVVLVNPNSPTGRHTSRQQLESTLLEAPGTRWWIDETYVDYAGPNESLETYAAASTNVVICKSMSKAYALSGARAAYLCGPVGMMDELRSFCPPWSVSLPGQIAACEALTATDYYRARWEETGVLRAELLDGLEELGWEVVPGCANFLLCHLPSSAPDAAALVAHARTHGLFVRDVANMGVSIDARTLRVAVKDRGTNRAMVEILRITMAEMAAAPSRFAA